MATKNYRYLKDGSKNPNYVSTSSAKKPTATSSKTITQTGSSAGAKKTSTGSSTNKKRYNSDGTKNPNYVAPSVNKEPQKEKEKEQLPKLKAWGNAIKDFLTGGKDEKEKEPAKEQQKSNDFDAQFTEDFFENNDRARYLVGKGVDGTTAQEKAEFVLMDRMLQAGVTNRAKVGGEDNRYKTSDEVYDVNNTVNQGASQIWMDGFYKQANEDDIRAVINNWQQMIDLAPEGSDFRRRVQEDMDALKEYAKNNYASFANEEIRRIGEDMATTRASLERKSMDYDADLLAGANDALEAGRSGYNLYDYVGNRPELREAVGFDELEAQYEDPDDFTDALRQKLETIAGAETAVQDKAQGDEQALYGQLEAQQAELDKMTGIYTNLLKGDKYNRMTESASAIEAGRAFEKSVGGYNAGKWVQDTATGINGDQVVTDVRFDVNKASLDQIVKNPQAVQQVNNGLEMPDAETDYRAALAAQMTPEEKEKYWALRATPGNGEELAQEYFEWLEKNATAQRRSEAVAAAAAQRAEGNVIGTTFESFGTNVLGSIGTAAQTIRGALGMEVDQYSPSLDYTRVTGAYRDVGAQKAAEALNFTIPGLNVNAGELLYGVATSLGDMGVALAMGGAGTSAGGSGAGKVITQIVMSSGASANTFVDALDKGIDPQVAATQAVMAGMIEYATERYSVEALFKNVTPDNFKSAIAYIGKNMLTEGTEEAAADLLNDAFDVLLNTDEAELWEKYTDYTNNGYTSKEALARLAGEALSKYGTSAAAGAISGGTMAGGNVAVQGIQQNAEYRSVGKQLIENGNASAVIQAGLKSVDEKVRKLAGRLADKIGEFGLPNDSETAAEVQVIAEAEGIDANGQKVEAAPSAQEMVPAFEIKQPDAEAVPVQTEPVAAQQPAEQASVRTEEVPAEVAAEETGSTSASEETPELAWNKDAPAPAAEKPAANEGQSIKQVFTGSKAKLGKLYTKVMKALDVDIATKGMADMTERIQARLKQLGEDTIEPVASAIAKLVTGEKPTQEELDLPEGNTVREGVLNEVTRSIIRNGGSEFMSDATRNQMATRSALQQATTQKGVQMPDGKKAAAPAKEKVQTIVEETVAADKEGSIQTRASMLGNEEAAQTMISMAEGVTNTRAYAEAFEDAYDFGTASIDENVARTSALTTALTPEQFKAAYQAGVKAAASPVRAVKTGGKVTFADDLGSRISTLDGNQRSAINALQKIASLGTVNIEFFESTANEEGKYTAENGSYNPETNTIRIDINAGKNSVDSVAQYALLRTASHELTHYIKAQNTEGYKALQDFVVKQLTAKNGNDFDGLVALKMKQQPNLSYAQAVEEVVADGCEMMLKDSTAIQQLAQENKGLFRRIARWLRNFMNNVKKAFQGVEATSMEARMIQDVEGLQKLWDEALVQASRNVQQSAVEDIGITTNDGGDTAFVENPEMLYSLRSYNESDYVQERDKAAAALAKKMGVSVETAEAYIDDVTSIAAIVAADRDRLDFEAEDEYSAMKHNSEYKYTMDFSTLCKKRLLYTGTFDAIQKQLGDTALTEDDYIQLRQMMAERGYEVACAFCYVESRRKNNGEIINKFLETYKAAQKNGTAMELGPSNRRKAFETEDGFTPKISNFNTSEGIANIMHNHRGVYDAYMYFMNARGVSKPKLIESRTDYRNEILKKFRSASAVRAMNRRGGLRLQSFSDFEVVNMLDMMQVVMDMSRVGLMSQAYTKVPAFARVFGGTGVKINLSLVTKGVDKNGKLIFDDIEGMPHKEAFKIREMYSDHVGTILVGKDDATIRAAMADPRIDFIIPYHASGWSIENQNALGIGSYTNFTAGQNEVNAATGKTAKNFQPSEYWDYSKTGDENAQAYLEKCREAGKIPKFPQYQNYPGYWKMLIDFKMYNNDGVGSPQRAVRPDFNLDEARQIMKGYEGGHQNLPVARDVVKDFVAQYKEKRSGVMYSPRAKADSNEDIRSIKTQISDNASVLNSMEPVYSKYIKLPSGNKETVEKWAKKELASTGYQVERQNFGRIIFDEGRINTSFNYLNTPAEYAAILAVPRVLKRGIEITTRDSHKYRGFPTITFAAPVEINGVRGNMAVVVKQEKKNVYKTHRILMPDGSAFEYNENAEPTPTRGVVSEDPFALSIGSAFDNSVTQNRADGNKKFSIRTDSLSDREILADSLADVASNDNERAFLAQYRSKIADLQQKQSQLRAINKDIADRKAKAERKPNGRIVYDGELIKQQNRAKILREQIDREDNAIIKLIQSKPLQDVLRRQKKRIEGVEAGKRQEAIAKVRDRRNATEMRHKIKAVLDDFNRRLKNPTEKSYIPANMVQLVIAAEELIDTRSGREGEKAQAKLAAIHGMYERYKSDATFAYVYDPIISDMLANMANAVGNRSIYDLTTDELGMVYDTLKALKKQVTEAVQLKAGNYARTIIEAGREMIRETQAAAPLAKGKAGEYINWQLTPDKFFARLAGFKKDSVWSKVAKTFADGTEKMMEIQRDHYYHFKRFTESKEFDKLNDRKHLVDIGLKDEKGNTVKVTRGMMLSAYMHLLNEENARGFMYGGFSIPNLKTYYDGKVKESYGTGSANTRGTSYALYELAQRMNDPDLTEEQLAAMEGEREALIQEGLDRLEKMRSDIEGQLTQYEKDLIKAVQEWNNGKSQQYINDVTMDLYGIKKASTENYFPIHRDTAFVNTDFASISKNMNLENWGSLKTRVPSQAPILLEDIAYVMDSSLNQMSRYVGYARAQRDFNKLYNVKMPGMSGSVKKVVSVKFGAGAKKIGVTGEQYIENYIGDITGSRQSEGGLLTPIRRNLVRSTMTLNLRVGFSQLSAIPKAAAEVGWDSMVKGFVNGGFKAIFSKNAREQLAQENVWFWQRWRGEGGQKEFADARGGGNVVDKAYNWVADSKIGRYLFNWCQNFDVMSTVSMKSMAEAWVKKNTRYAPGSAEYNAAVQEKYRDIIRNTQAMSSTTERSDLARTTSDGYSLLTMFKSEAFANFNLLYDAVVKARKYNADFKAGINGVTKADVTEARKHLASAATSVIIGASLGNALLKLVINALMHSMNGYRDDEEEITPESVLASVTKEVASDMAGMLAIGGELYEFISAVALKEKYYTPSDMALGEIGEMLETVYNTLTDEDATIDDVLNAGKKVAFNLTNIFGVPAENGKRYVKAIQDWYDERKHDTPWYKYEGGFKRSNGLNYDRLYNAALNGDDEKFTAVLAELVVNGVEDAKAIEGFREQVKEAYEGGDITEDKALELLVSHGGKDKDDAFWMMEKWNYTGEDNYSKYADLRTALKESNGSAAKAEIQKLTGHGVEEKTVISELSSMYNSGEATTILNLQLRSNNLYTSNLKLKADKEVHKDDFDAFLTAVVTGSNVTNEANKLYQKGYTTKQIMSALNGAFGNSGGKKYRRMEYYNPSEAKILLDRILKAYEAIGLDRNEEIAWINENWEKFVPETD